LDKDCRVAMKMLLLAAVAAAAAGVLRARTRRDGPDPWHEATEPVAAGRHAAQEDNPSGT